MHDDPLRDCVLGFAAGIQPPPNITVSEWADANRILPRTSAEPGQWHTSRVPFLREVMDRLSPQDPCEMVVVMKGAQLAFTSAAENWIGSSIELDPSTFLMVQPTTNTARDYAKDRITPLVTGTPSLVGLVSEQKSRAIGGSTTTRKEFPGGFLIVTGANSAAELRSKSIRRLALDEVDGYPLDVDGEGDPVALAMRRTATFGNRKILIFSTPTIMGSSRIEAEYSGTDDQRKAGFSPTDQRHYFVPCPECGEMQELLWEHVKWTELGRPPHEAAYVCPHCARVVENHEKGWMLEHGEWRATATADNPKVHGYWITGLYRPHGWRSWGDIASDWVKATRTKDTALLRVVVNTDLGQTWDLTDGHAVDPGTLMARVEPPSVECDQRVIVLTAGVDVQGDRLEMEIVGWGEYEESWSVHYQVIQGDPVHGDVWDILDEILLTPIPHPLFPAGIMIQAVAVDSGYSTQRVCEFTRPRRHRRVWAVMGAKTAQHTPRPIWNKKPTKPGRGKYDVYIVGQDTAKAQLSARLSIEEEGPGYCHFSGPHNDEAYFAQLTAEKLRTKYRNGRAVFYWWKPDHKRNEALDCRVYATAALHGLRASGFKLSRPKPKPKPKPQSVPSAAPRASAPAPRPAPRRQPSRGTGRPSRSTW